MTHNVDQLIREGSCRPRTTLYEVIHPKTMGRLGTVRWVRHGWHFISNVSSHGNSRKLRPTASAAIPRWAKKMGAKLV